jgi:PKD repeat protein
VTFSNTRPEKVPFGNGTGHRWASRLLVWLFLGGAVVGRAGSPDAAQTLTFTPVADATIKKSLPTSNYGSSTILEADNSPVEQFLVKFTVSGVGAGTVTSAKLRLYNVNGSNKGGAIRRVTNPNWSEATVTWNNQPAVDSTVLVSLGAVSSGRWYEVNLTGHVTGDGDWSFHVSTTSSDGADYRSREGPAATRPQLIVVIGSGSASPGPLTANAGPDQFGNEGASFQFTGSATGGTSPYTFAWSFGDGTSGSGASVTHVYRDNGSFTVTLTVTDATNPNQTAQDTAMVTVANVGPTANPGGPYSGVVGSLLIFSGSATDASADDTAAGLTFAWDFGDGNTGVGSSPSHVYAAAATYTVRLTVTDKDGGWGSVTTTAAIGEPSAGFVVTAAGDYSANSNTDAVLRKIVPSGSNLHLALGDLSYGKLSPESAWCTYVKDRVGATFPFQLISGNHDDGGSGDANINNFAACLPDRVGGTGTYGKEYYFDYQGLARFILIAPGLTIDGVTYDYRAGGARYAWVANAIDGARLAGIPWVIVGMHYNCISAGKYGCQTGTDLMNLLVAKRADLVLHAHDHTYQRSKQLAHGFGCSAVPTGSVNASCIVDDGADEHYPRGAGTVFVVVGTGGADLYNVSTDDSEAGYFARLMGANSNASRGFLKATVTATAMTVEFVPAVGTFTDRFTIAGP